MESWFWPTLAHVKRLFYPPWVTSWVYFYSPVTPDIPFLFFRIISNSNILKTDIFSVLLGYLGVSTVHCHTELSVSVTQSHGLHLLQLWRPCVSDLSACTHTWNTSVYSLIRRTYHYYKAFTIHRSITFTGFWIWIIMNGSIPWQNQTQRSHRVTDLWTCGTKKQKIQPELK